MPKGGASDVNPAGAYLQYNEVRVALFSGSDTNESDRTVHRLQHQPDPRPLPAYVQHAVNYVFLRKDCATALLLNIFLVETSRPSGLDLSTTYHAVPVILAAAACRPYNQLHGPNCNS